MLHNAATEPEVVEFALFLKRMGAIAPTQACSRSTDRNHACDTAC